MRLSDELKQEKERSEKEENQRRSFEALLKVNEIRKCRNKDNLFKHFKR